MLMEIVNTGDIYSYILYVFPGTYTTRVLLAFFELLFKKGPYFLINIIIQCALNRFLQRKGLSLKI